MADRYWVGGTASWDGTAGTKWALTSGGAGGQAIPTSADDVYFDANSGAVTVTIAAGNTGAKSISCTSGSGDFTGTLTGTAAITVSGSVTLVAGMTFSSNAIMALNGTGTITSAGKTFSAINISGSGITVNLGDALTCSSGFTVTQGTFSAGTYNVTADSFSSSNTNVRTINMGSGLWTITGTSLCWVLTTTTNLTFNKDTANIIYTSNTTGTRQMNNGAQTYNKVTIAGNGVGGQFSFNGAATFSELASTNTVAHSILLLTALTVGNWTVTGSAGNVVTLASATTALRQITKTGGGFFTGIDYLSIRDVVGTPTDTWYVGSNSTYISTPPNSGYGFFTTQRANNAIIVLTDTTGSATWTVPSDWNNSSNSINLIGGGGGGGGSYVSGNNRAAGGGGGGGGYTKLTNQSLTIGANISYQAGAAGTGGLAGGDGVAGGTTSWNSGASTAGGGGGGQATTTPTSTVGSA